MPPAAAAGHGEDENGEGAWRSFAEQANRFLESTDRFVQEGVNPGGYYKAVWCRDAAYILRDWFLTGRFADVMQELLYIWSHQINSGSEKVIYGRGSPEMKYMSRVARPDAHKRFEGALPTTIFHGFSEVYGMNPDIDSTALMVSTTAWVFDTWLKSGMAFVQPEHLHGEAAAGMSQELSISSVVLDPAVAMDFVIPRLLLAIDHLAGRDADGDGLLEQGHNEDWMDTVLRSGKIVYSQACWIMALHSTASLLSELGMGGEVERLRGMAEKATRAVEQKLWSEEDGTYVDWWDEPHVGGPRRTLTQDVALYVVATTEDAATGTRDDGNSSSGSGTQGRTADTVASRAARTLDALSKRIWKSGWPLVTEAELKKTGPWVLHPNQYHNHTLWPWITGIEMLARGRLDRTGECRALLSMLVEHDSQSQVRAFYEWVNPVTNLGSGAYPFRTGISAIRIAIYDALAKRRRREHEQWQAG